MLNPFLPDLQDLERQKESAMAKIAFWWLLMVSSAAALGFAYLHQTVAYMMAFIPTTGVLLVLTLVISVEQILHWRELNHIQRTCLRSLYGKDK